MNFKDHFSKQAAIYAEYRPGYPDKLFSYLSSLVNSHSLALDCATGNGQAAIGIAPYFEKVVAVDPSQAQLDQAFPHPKVHYLLASAEECPLAEQSVDLITIASGIHWFEREQFYAHAKKILKSNGVIAAWVYHGWSSPLDLHELLYHYEQNIVGKYWPNQFQKSLYNFYQELPFPFKEVKPPNFDFQMKVDAKWIVGYLRTWSATQRYMEAKSQDPTDLICNELQKKLGASMSDLSFKLVLRIGRKS